MKNMQKRQLLLLRLSLFVANFMALTAAVDCFAPKYPQIFQRAEVQDEKVKAVAAHDAT